MVVIGFVCVFVGGGELWVEEGLGFSFGRFCIVEYGVYIVLVILRV